MLTAKLPENYTPEGKFPVFVFVNGGNGGRGDNNTARQMVGARDFITVNLPLFKEAQATDPPKIPGFNYNPAQIVLPSDAEILRKSYCVMLQKLFATVPNTTPERSAFGGFSNGAHATANLVTGGGDFFTEHFSAFCFFEGGFSLALNPTALAAPALKTKRFLLIMGGRNDTDQRKTGAVFIKALTDEAAKDGLDFQHVIMPDRGHEMPSEYVKLTGAWVRGEKIENVK